MTTPVLPVRMPERKIKHTLAVLAVLAFSLAACSSGSDAKPVSKSATCEELCTDLGTLAAETCTRPEVHECAGTLTDKVLLSDKVETAVESEELSSTVGYIRTKVDLIGTLGERFGKNKCFTAGANSGDDLFECRTTAQDIDERFAELLELVQKLPA